MRFAIVIERPGDNFSAYVPDLLGCVATGASIEEISARRREAITFHLEGLRAGGIAMAEPTSRVDDIGVAASRGVCRSLAP